MFSRRSRIILVITLLISLSLACSLTGSEDSATDGSSENAIATSVAATIAAKESDQQPANESPPTQHPTVTAGPPPANFNYAGVSFYFNPILADDVTAGVNPGYYEENNPWWSMPEHREFQFNNWVLSDAFHTPTIKVYPIADFRAINENVSDSLNALQLALDTKPADYTGLAVSDLFNAGQLYQSNVKYFDFQNGRGARWLSQYGQAYYSVGWPHLFYTYQGLTDEGLYYISIILPVNHPYLPDVDPAELDDEFYENYGAYRDTIVDQLESESDNTFVPSLVLLDQLVESITVLDQ